MSNVVKSKAKCFETILVGYFILTILSKQKFFFISCRHEATGADTQRNSTIATVILLLYKQNVYRTQNTSEQQKTLRDS